jgi:hypothetical protein
MTPKSKTKRNEMKHLTIGMVILLAAATTAFCFGEQGKREQIMLAGHTLGVLAMFCVAGMARQAELADRRRGDHLAPNRRVKLMTGLALTLGPTLAHALALFIFLACAIGAGVGLIGWGAIKLWSALVTVEERVNERNDELAAVTDTPPPLIAAAASPELPELQAAAADIATVAPGSDEYETVLVSTRPWLHVTRPPGVRLEWSINLLDWVEWDEQPVAATLPSAFWRAKRGEE